MRLKSLHLCSQPPCNRRRRRARSTLTFLGHPLECTDVPVHLRQSSTTTSLLQSDSVARKVQVSDDYTASLMWWSLLAHTMTSSTSLGPQMLSSTKQLMAAATTTSDREWPCPQTVQRRRCPHSLIGFSGSEVECRAHLLRSEFCHRWPEKAESCRYRE